MIPTPLKYRPYFQGKSGAGAKQFRPHLLKEVRMKPFIISRYTLSTDLAHKGMAYAVLFHTLTRAECILPKDLWVKIKKNDVSAITASETDTLRENGILLPMGTDESKIYSYWRRTYLSSFHTLKSRVLVTRRCDNRCRYCAIRPEAADMTHETAEKADALYLDLIRRKSPGKVRDVYLGGEPLLNPGVVSASAERRHRFCKERGIPYAFSITTNGNRLSGDLIKPWLALGLENIHVSLAGPEEVHDALRPPAAGTHKVGYRRILRNLMEVSPLTPIEIEYQFDNLSDDYLRFPEMLVDFDRHDIQISRINVTPIVPRRENNRFSGGFEDDSKMRHLHAVLSDAGFPVFDQPPGMGCMADFDAYLVFDADGSLLPCVSLQMGEMACGHVDTGIDDLALAQLERELPEKCMVCELLPACMGGCRLQAMIQHGNFNGVFCNYGNLKNTFEVYMRYKAGVMLRKSDEVSTV